MQSGGDGANIVEFVMLWYLAVFSVYRETKDLREAHLVMDYRDKR